MSAVVQICFEHTWSDEALHDGAKEFALHVKPEIPGLIWKIFLKDSVRPQSCGIYLFDLMRSAFNLLGDRFAGSYRRACEPHRIP